MITGPLRPRAAHHHIARTGRGQTLIGRCADGLLSDPSVSQATGELPRSESLIDSPMMVRPSIIVPHFFRAASALAALALARHLQQALPVQTCPYMLLASYRPASPPGNASRLRTAISTRAGGG